eukprot:162266_1
MFVLNCELFTVDISVGIVISAVLNENNKGKMRTTILNLSILFAACFSASYDPEQVHLSFGTNNYSDIFVSWASTGTNTYPSKQSYVTYGTTSGTYTLNATESKIYTYHDGGWNGLLYWSHLTSLQQGQKYYYKIISQSSESQEYSFTFNHPSLMPENSPFEFLLVGDLGAEDASSACTKSNGCSNATIKALKNEINDAEYSMLIHVGDIAYTGGVESIWDAYLKSVEDIAATIPYMLCPGNHEHYYNFTGFKSRFAMPNAPYTKGESNLFYSWIYGGIYFLSYSTEHNFTVGSAQYNFIINDLENNVKNNKNIKWKILYGHRPIYCSTSDEYDCDQNGPYHIEPIFEPLLKEYDFDLYFAGHLHNYERAYSVYNFSDITVNKEKGMYVNPKHTINVVIGMSGDTEGLTNSWYKQPDWSAFRIAQLGYAKIKVYNETNLLFEFVNSDNRQVVDTFTIQKQAN